MEQAEQEQQEWRSEFESTANSLISLLRDNAAGAREDINRDIRKAQERWHQADLEVNMYRTKKNQGTLVNPELLEMALEERERRFQELQRQQERITKVEAWADKKVREINALTDQARSGDVKGYRGLRHFDWTYHPSWFK